MSWNYRILKREVGLSKRESEFAVYEVYYSKEGLPNACSRDPQWPLADTFSGLVDDFLKMRLAFNKPVLDFLPLPDDEALIMRKSSDSGHLTLPPVYSLADVMKIAEAVRSAAASASFKDDEAYKRSLELGGGRTRLAIEQLSLTSIVSSCFPKPQPQAEEKDTK